MSKDVAAADCPPEEIVQGKIMRAEDAVKKLQEALGMPPELQTGVLGKITQGKLNALGDLTNPENLAKQSPDLQEAIEDFQKAMGGKDKTTGYLKPKDEDCKVDGASGQDLAAPPVSEDKGPMARPKEEGPAIIAQENKGLLHSGPPEKAPDAADPKAGFIAPEPAQMPPVDPMGNYTGASPEKLVTDGKAPLALSITTDPKAVETPQLEVISKGLPEGISGIGEPSEKANLALSTAIGSAGVDPAIYDKITTAPQWGGADGANPAFSGNTWSISEMFGKVASVFSGAAPAAAAPQPNTYVPQTGTNGLNM